MPSRVESSPEFLHRNNEGSITVIVGPMFSGKSDELIWILRQSQYAKLNVQAFKPEVDDRRGDGTINTFDLISFPATSIANSPEILNNLNKGVQVVGIDEAQFFDTKLTEVCKELADKKIQVVVAGLHSDFRGKTFGPMADLLIEADYVKKRQARCAICGGPASRTQRLMIEKGMTRPAYFDEPIIVVGGNEQYQARCRHCHEVPVRTSS